MSAKTALKAAKTALDSQKYEDAATEARKALEADPGNYFGLLFLGRALEKQGQSGEAAEVYRQATDIKPNDELAWKGLCGLYHSQGSQSIQKHTEASLKLAEIYEKSDDVEHCAVTINKLVDFARDNGSRSEYQQALEYHLPDKTYYNLVEGRIPSPSHTYLRIAELLETEERERINREIGERRMRIGARIGQVTSDVRREVFSTSRLQDIYQEVINWTADDQLRRTYEEKLLQRAHDHLVVASGADKTSLRDRVIRLAEDMVIIKHPFLLAWNIKLEWTDLESLEHLDTGVSYQYMDFFPTAGLAKALMAHFGLTEARKANKAEDAAALRAAGSHEADDTQSSKEARLSLSESERLILLGEALELSRSSLLAHRIAADLYLSYAEYESCSEIARVGLSLVDDVCRRSGSNMQYSQDGISLDLATALVYFQSPKNHPESREIFEQLLVRRPQDSRALLGIGLIHEERGDFSRAKTFLSEALLVSPLDARIRAEAAWCSALDGDLEAGLQELRACSAELSDAAPDLRDLRASVSYKIGQCMWKLSTSRTERKDRSGPYSQFISAVRLNPTFAPAYTSLGVYYADYAKDRKRARQCFQKSFELAATEVESAHRLAQDFARSEEWEIVEAIAKRVIDSGVVRPPPGSLRPGHGWPFSALGIIQLNRQEIASSTASFQTALRICPGDYNSWVGLGESYYSSGRYNAARRALEHAIHMNEETEAHVSGHNWFANYMLSNVHRELGNYMEAVDGYRTVLLQKPSDYGASISLAQTLSEHALASLHSGFYGLAVERSIEALCFLQETSVEVRDSFNFWKAIGDSCAVLSLLPDRPIQGKAHSASDILAGLARFGAAANEDADGSEFELTEDLHSSVSMSKLAVKAYQHVLTRNPSNTHAHAVAYYNVGWAQYLAYQIQRRAGHSPLESSKAVPHMLKHAMRNFKKAIELEASNADFWNALGVVTISVNPRVSQHSLIRSLNIQERSSRTWTNLGVLYLTQNDIQLAHSAFTRAQSSDPENALAWLGEGIVALMTGEHSECDIHISHAVEIADAAALSVKSRYAVSSFDRLASIEALEDVLTFLIHPSFELRMLRRLAPEQSYIRHILALVQERIGEYDESQKNLQELALQAEESYERDENDESYRVYVIVMSDLARVQFARRCYKEAIATSETVIALTAESAQPSEGNILSKARLSAHLVSALSCYWTQDSGTAVQMLEAISREFIDDQDLICIFASVLWAHSATGSPANAREQLFSSAECKEGHVETTMMIGATSALDGDDVALDAVVQDLRRMSMDLRSENGRTHIESLLDLLSVAQHPESDEAAKATTILSPNRPTGWQSLANTTADSHAIAMATSTAKRAVPPSGDMEPWTLSQAFAAGGTMAEAQSAAVLTPWSPTGFQAMACLVQKSIPA